MHSKGEKEGVNRTLRARNSGIQWVYYNKQYEVAPSAVRHNSAHASALSGRTMSTEIGGKGSRAPGRSTSERDAHSSVAVSAAGVVQHSCLNVS